MPKDSGTRKPRAPRLQSSTAERRARAQRIQDRSLEMPFRCERCEQKNLRCFVNTATSCCASCISVKAECSLFVPKEEWEKVKKEKEEKRLALLRSEAETSRLRLKLAKVESHERHFARCDLALLKAQDQAQEAESSSTATGPFVSDPWADPGWLQANDPSFDLPLD